MGFRAIFGRYWPYPSVIHELDARTKLIAVLVMAVLLFMSSNLWALGIVALFVAIAFALAHVPICVIFRTILPLVFIVLVTAIFNMLYVQGGEVVLDWGWLSVTADGLMSAMFMVFRLFLLLLLGALLTLTTTTMEITNAIEWLLSPLARIGLPIGEFAFVLGTALRFLPQLAEDFHSIRMAQDARGAHLSTRASLRTSSISSFVVPLFASVFRHADTLADAMESRCYHPGANMKRLKRKHLGIRDVVVLSMVAVVGVLVVCASIFG